MTTASVGTISTELVSEVTYLEAITTALGDELADDDRVVLLGEDIGHMGGAFRVTKGLVDRFGEERVIDTPMAEIGLIGCAIGLAIAGLRPIVELQFADFISCAYDQLVTQAAKLHYRFGITVPLVVRAPSGGGLGGGPFHSQSPEGIFAHVPGLKLVCPWSIQDAYDLLRAAVADVNPVIFFEHKGLYRSHKGELQRRRPARSLIPSARIRRVGRDVTVVTYGACVGRSLEAAAILADRGVSVEVIDLRMVQPIDTAAVCASVQKTARLVVVHEDTRSSGIGAEVAARVAELNLYTLDAPIVRITAPDTPVPYAEPLESLFLPASERIADGILQCARY